MNWRPPRCQAERACLGARTKTDKLRRLTKEKKHSRTKSRSGHRLCGRRRDLLPTRLQRLHLRGQVSMWTVPTRCDDRLAYSKQHWKDLAYVLVYAAVRCCMLTAAGLRTDIAEAAERSALAAKHALVKSEREVERALAVLRVECCPRPKKKRVVARDRGEEKITWVVVLGCDCKFDRMLNRAFRLGPQSGLGKRKRSQGAKWPAPDLRKSSCKLQLRGLTFEN